MASSETTTDFPGRRISEKVLFTWRAKSRPFKRREREFWVSIFAIAAVCSFILFIIEGVMSVILVISLVFLFYVLSTVEPDVIEYSITSMGVKIVDRRIDMDLIIRFWFSERFGANILVFDLITFPGRLELVVDSKDQSAIRKALTPYIPEEEAPPTRMDKAANWLAGKIPANK